MTKTIEREVLKSGEREKKKAFQLEAQQNPKRKNMIERIEKV